MDGNIRFEESSIPVRSPRSLPGRHRAHGREPQDLPPLDGCVLVHVRDPWMASVAGMDGLHRTLEMFALESGLSSSMSRPLRSAAFVVILP